MDVEAVGEGLLQLRDIADVCQQAQLDLGIVRADQHMARVGDEALADLAAFLGADRDILQVRIRRGQASGRGRCQRIGRVHAVGFGVEGGDQIVGVGALQL